MLAADIDEALRDVVAARIALAAKEAELVVRARSYGASWDELGRSLGVSKQAVRKRHLAIDPIANRPSTRAPTIAEYHAELAAAIRAKGG